MENKAIQDRVYVVLSTKETGSIDFSEVYETAANTMNTNVSGSKTFVKWEGAMPDTVSKLRTKEGPYTHTEMLTLLQKPEWAGPDQPI